MKLVCNNVFDHLAGDYDKWFYENDKIFDSEVLAVSSLLEKDTEYYDIGCGTGIFSSRLNLKKGVEPSEEMAAFAKKRGMEVLRGTAQNLPFEADSRQGLVMITVDCFIEDIEAIYSEAHRVLKKGGHMIFAFLDAATPLGELYESTKSESEYYRNAIFRPAKTRIELLKKHGFEVTDSKQTVFTQENVPQEVKDGLGEGLFAVIKAVKL